MAYEKNIVKKPWGYEYLAYSNSKVALWFLSISPDQQTSMHCNPSKTTGLMLLEGSAHVSFLSNKFMLSPYEKIMIRKGLFHSTKSDAKTGACVFEIETPVNKHDLVRLEDSYGREGKPYEDETFEMPKADDCLWLTDPASGEKNVYKHNKSLITVSSVQNLEEVNVLPSGTNVMFLSGGILTDYNINVAGPGDIVDTDVIRKLSKVFQKISPNTVILTVNKNE